VLFKENLFARDHVANAAADTLLATLVDEEWAPAVLYDLNSLAVYRALAAF
jgi:hypothetical protein